MYLKKTDTLLFINFHESVLTPGAYELILLQDENQSNEDKTDTDIEINLSNLKNSCPKGNRGQRSTVLKFLKIFDKVC